MADVVNLRMQRKKRRKAGEEATAAARRAIYGQTKNQKTLKAAEVALETRKLDGHKRDEAKPTPERKDEGS